MKFELNFEECLKDSPRFRSSLTKTESSVDNLELKLEKVVRLCASMIEVGKQYSQSNGLFVSGLAELAAHFGGEGDYILKANISIFADLLREIQGYFNILMEQAHRSICKNLHDLVKEDIRKVREAKKSFEKMSGDLDQALSRNAGASRLKPAECEEASNYLTAVRGCFSHTAMDYVYQIGLLQGRQRFVVLDTLLSFVHAQSTFFHQGSDSFQDVESDLKNAATNLENFSLEMSSRMKEMDERHDLVQKRETSLRAESAAASTDSVSFNGQAPPIVSETEEANLAAIEGYLFKRTTNAFRTWNRRWFMLKDNQLIYCKRECGMRDASPVSRNSSSKLSGSQSASASPYPRHRDSANSTSVSVAGFPSVASSSSLSAPTSFTVMEGDLRLCSVKPLPDAVDRRFCFEVVSPAARHLLQADSDSECLRWIAAIQHGVSQAYRHAAQESVNGPASLGSSRNSFADGRLSARNSPTPTKKDAAAAAAAAAAGKGVKGDAGGDSAAEVGVDSPDGDASDISLLHQLVSVSGNDRCCDCSLPDPRWASINLGIVLCIECSGIHRSLGVHLSKVRSLTLDAWEPESVKVMGELGNDVVNAIYLANPDVPVISSSSSRAEKEAWIKAKYVERRFVVQLPRLTPESGDGGADDGDSNVGIDAGSGEGVDSSRNSLAVAAGRWTVAPTIKKRESKRYNNNDKLAPAPVSESAPRIVDGADVVVGAAEVEVRIENVDPSSASNAASPTPEKAASRTQQTVLATASSSSRSTPETSDSILVFDGFAPWRIRSAGNEDSKEADVGLMSPETASLEPSSSSPSISSMASGDPLREDVLEDVASFSPDRLLFRAARQRNLRVMCLALAHRASANCVPFPADGRTPLMEAVASGSIAACEYLLLNGAKLDAADVAGKRTALHHATILGHTGQVCQFLKRGANQSVVDINGLDAISVAVNAANADIVTLLRLAKLNEEIKESELGNPGDATFSEVFKDFSNMAAEDPDQLNNRYQLLSQNEDGV